VTPARALAHWRGRCADALARRRVALGFLCGALAWWLAQPTWRSLALGSTIAVLGEALRLWAAGHVEKSREVTQSGPYRFVRHPLYVGSSIIAAGVAVASAHPVVGLLAAAYVGTTIPAAIRAEEAHLREKFGDAYDAYAHRRAAPQDRNFEWQRVVSNREHHTMIGIIAAMVALATKVVRASGG
jgi:hypothetical protein